MSGDGGEPIYNKALSNSLRITKRPELNENKRFYVVKGQIANHWQAYLSWEVRKVEETAKTREELVTELSELQQRIAKLAAERNLLLALTDSLPHFLYIKDTKSRFVICNTAVARLMGVEIPEELAGKTDFDFYPKELAEHYYEHEQKIIQSGESLINHEEALLNVATGERGWLSTTKMPLRDESGKIMGIVGIGTDITAEKRREAKWGK